MLSVFSSSLAVLIASSREVGFLALRKVPIDPVKLWR
jgi:hypothetical protein